MDARCEFGGYTLDARERSLVRRQKPIKLRRRAFDLLCVLVANAGRLVEPAVFFQQVWGGVAVSKEVLKVTVRELRAALSDDAKRPSFIETIAKSGYRFIAAVTRRPREKGGPRAPRRPAESRTD